MYENGEPLLKIWNVVTLRERSGRDFDTCMRASMTFGKACSNHAERKTYSVSIADDIWKRVMFRYRSN